MNTRTLTVLVIYSTLLTFTTSQDFPCAFTCNNGGTCLNGLSCQCTPQWSGLDCTTPVCNPTTLCGDNGYCSAPDTCTCSPGWVGATCQTFVCPDGCYHGQCTAPNTCSCEDGWTDPTCSTAICLPFGCENGGKCVAPNTCNCDTTSGWVGPTCGVPVCNSTTGLCQHGSDCIGAGVCNCTNAPGWTGKTCKDDINECLKSGFQACDKLTKCYNNKGSYICSACPSGYSGDGKTGCYPTCPQGCINGGKCVKSACDCSGTGYTGATCFADLDECAVGGYCDPKVQCQNQMGSYVCLGDCPDGYSGSPYMNAGGCSPICPNGCPTNSTCIKPGVCSSGAYRLVFSVLPIVVCFLIFAIWQ